MYSETAVRMSSNQMTDEGFDQRCTLLSHLSYVPGDSSGDGGTRTHNPRIRNHVLQSAVGHVLLATKVVKVTRSQVSAASRKQSEAEAVGIEPYTPIRQSPLYPNAQRRVAKSVVYYGRPYR